jgi:hypothetical protein
MATYFVMANGKIAIIDNGNGGLASFGVGSGGVAILSMH